MEILVLYYSGVGNTKMVATKIVDILKSSHNVTLASIEKFSYEKTISNYDALMIGFPTIHATPASPILTFIEHIKQLQNPIPTFLFTTCGLYSANTLRIFAKRCKKKNVLPILSRSYRCAATDGILIAPFMRVWFYHEKNLDEKIRSDIGNFMTILERQTSANIPRFKLYSILNYPNKILGQCFLPKIYTHTDKCVLCGKCIKNCPVQCISKDSKGVPLIDTKKCIHCYRCIHHCPQKALSLSKNHIPVKTLYY